MVKILLLSFFCCSSVFAQNMADKEDYKNAYANLPDGSSIYIGKCSTHEDYQKTYFTINKVLQAYIEPSDLSEAEMKAVLAKFDKAVITKVLSTFGMYDLVGKETSSLTIFKNYIDDMTVESLSHALFTGLDLIRFNLGVGGGNGGYIVFNKVKNGPAVTYELMSYSFDSDLSYCDKKVWL